MALLLFEWQWAEAEDAFKKALALNPGYMQGMAWYWLFCRAFAAGDFARAIQAMKDFWARDTLSSYAAAVVAVGYAAGRPGDPEVFEWSNRALELDPQAFLSKWVVQLAHGSVQDWDNAIEAAHVTL
jgi:tetratricopeptide (TPR) repeat protein